MTQDYVPAKVPTAGQVVSVILQMSTFGVLSVCIMRRTQRIQKWASLPLAMWLILIIYADSALFVFATAIVVHGWGINTSREICEGGILLCLVCYMTTKIVIYYFLVEKAYIVRGSMKSRMKSKLWLFNCLFMLLPYTVFVILNFVFRITYINDKGICIIGMQKIAMLPLITFEVVVNVYLTLLFVLPLRSLYSYKTNQNPALNRMAFRSFVGSCATLTTSVANLTILMVLKGEPGWICLMCCNADILFCVLVLHWVSSKDKVSNSTLQNSGVSNRSRSDTPHRFSIALELDKHIEEGPEETVKKSYRNSLSIYPFDTRVEQPQQAFKLSNNIVTECKGSSTPSRTKTSRSSPKQLSSSDTSRVGKDEDELELHNILVTRQVDIDTEMGKRSDSEDADEWVGEERRVVGEKMV